jgi:hypothetical protein
MERSKNHGHMQATPKGKIDDDDDDDDDDDEFALSF